MWNVAAQMMMEGRGGKTTSATEEDLDERQDESEQSTRTNAPVGEVTTQHSLPVTAHAQGCHLTVIHVVSA